MLLHGVLGSGVLAWTWLISALLSATQINSLAAAELHRGDRVECLVLVVSWARLEVPFLKLKVFKLGAHGVRQIVSF